MLFDEKFPGEEPQGVKKLVPKLLAAVNVRFPNAARTGGRTEAVAMSILFSDCQMWEL